LVIHAVRSNNSFKPNLLRSTKSAASKACHAFASTTQVGLIQVLGVTTNMTECPYCHRRAMSQLRKSFLGPALSASCISCGKTVSVPLAAMLAVTPFLFSMVLAELLAPDGWQFAALSLLIGISSMAAIHAFLVPLVPRDT
jgi:hypothetical protein